MTSTKRFSPEVRERAVRLVFDQTTEHNSQWACIEAIAPKIGCTPQTLRTWVKQTEIDEGRVDGVTTSDRERLKALERENRELKKANEILRKASAYFAQAELDGQATCADRSDGALYRRSSCCLWRRVDLQATADCAIAVLRSQTP